MSFREQTAWIGLAAMGAFWLWYAFGLYLAVAEARTESSYFVGLLVSGALVCAAVQAGLTSLNWPSAIMAMSSRLFLNSSSVDLSDTAKTRSPVAFGQGKGEG